MRRSSHPVSSTTPGRGQTQQKDLIESICAECKFPALLSTFSIDPRYALDAKIVEPRDGETFIGLFVAPSVVPLLRAQSLTIQKNVFAELQIGIEA